MPQEYKQVKPVTECKDRYTCINYDYRICCDLHTSEKYKIKPRRSILKTLFGGK